MNYLDSSGLVKLVIREAETEILREWLEQRVDGITSSELVLVEVIRTVRRSNPRALPAARSFLAGLDLVPLTTSILNQAAEVEGEVLRSLDAIHLASALVVPNLSAFVAYDRRLLEAATNAGLACISPQ